MLQGMLQQLQVTFDANILLNVLEFYGFVTSVKSYSKRVCTSVFPGSPAFTIFIMRCNLI